MASAKSGCYLWFVLLLVYSAGLVSAQTDGSCYGAGSIATSVILSVLCTAVVLGVGFYWWDKRRRRTDHLILETDPEKGKVEYAFDNPGFKDAGLTPITKSLERDTAKFDSNKSKWNHWPAFSGLSAKSEKRKTLDDSAIEGSGLKVVALRSHDFAGLGFNICGNMKEGIYIKEVLHRGPASESGKLTSGDRINSVTISFEHIVYKDALTILSCASPYEIIIEAKGSKFTLSGSGQQPGHPVYRSSSCIDLLQGEKSTKRKLYGEDYTSSIGSDHSLHKSMSNMTTLERRESPSPKLDQPNLKKSTEHNRLSSEQLKNQLEHKILADHEYNLRNKIDNPAKIQNETQKTENKYQKFGVRVLPFDQQKSPKIAELSQNENNINIERNKDEPTGLDEVDNNSNAPTAKKREKKSETSPEKMENYFVRNGSLNGSGIKRDSNGIPQEIPNHMFNAAVAARRNRRSQDENVGKDEDDNKTPKKLKGKAPAPPDERKETLQNQYDAIQSITGSHEDVDKPNFVIKTSESSTNATEEVKDYNSDSDVETDNQSSVNTIELNSSDITIHHEDNEEKQNRKTASTGDLTKIQKMRKTSTGTLERAQSLDITDTGIPTLSKKRKAGRIEDSFDRKSDEDIFGKAMLNKEPRLSLILDGLNTFQRNRLKKSTEWGNLEDAILKINPQDVSNISPTFDETISTENINFDFGDKSIELDALVNRIKEIRRESVEINMDAIELEHVDSKFPIVPSNVTKKNDVWPSLEIVSNKTVEIEQPPIMEVRKKTPPPIHRASRPSSKVQNEIWPHELDDSNQSHSTNGKLITEKPVVGSVTHKNELLDMYILSVENNEPKIEKQKYNGSQSHPIIETKLVDKLEKTNLSNHNFTEANVEPVIFEKVKVHKRQQIPTSSDEQMLPPDSSDMTLEREIFDELNKNYPTPSKTDEILIIPEIKERIAAKQEQNKCPMVGFELIKRKSKMDEVKSETPVVFRNNPETGEVCACPVKNNTDESKTTITLNEQYPKVLDETESFLFNERFLCSQDDGNYPMKSDDINISDDIKVSRHSLGSLERPKSDDIKSFESVKHFNNISNIIVSNVHNGSPHLHSLELSVNEPINQIDDSKITDTSELYTTALEETDKNDKDLSKVTISTPDLIKNVTITEAINTLNNEVMVEGPSSITLELPNDVESKKTHSFNLTASPSNNKNILIAKDYDNNQNLHDKILSENGSSKNNSSMTYITEIQVLTPTNNTSNGTNVSEIEIIPNSDLKGGSTRNLDNAFENYVKNFECNVKSFEPIVHNFETNVRSFNKPDANNVTVIDKIEAEKELHKIQEIVEEQLKKLPEMRFTTSSYEGSKIPEKRQSQIEILRSNFEKSPPKISKTEIGTKSRIPIATTMKTPPTSPERRDSRNLDTENQREILELMSSSIHSTPNVKFQKSPPNKNVTVTSIRSNSKIPSGLPILGGNRPPIPPRKIETSENDTVIQVSTNGNISSFKQWVFDPIDSVTNISLSGQKSENK